MTVIAWDGRRLAADKRISFASGSPKIATKIWKGREVGELLGICGNADVSQELRAWYMNGAEPTAFPASARSAIGELIVFTKDRVSSYVAGPYATVFECANATFGSGGECARTAMYLGCDAVRAVEIACHFRGDCGGGIDVLELEA